MSILDENKLGDYRKWSEKEWWETITIKDDTTTFLDVLREIYIHRHEGVDKLRWGYFPKGTFNIKEGYDIRTRGGEEREEIW